MREANLVVDDGTITSHIKRIRRSSSPSTRRSTPSTRSTAWVSLAGMTPRFSLRVKLALVLLALAALPLAGILYVNEVERFLLQEQEQSLLAVARAVATALHERPQLLASASGRDDEVDAILLGLQRASSRIWVVDGRYQVIAAAGACGGRPKSLRKHRGGSRW